MIDFGINLWMPAQIEKSTKFFGQVTTFTTFWL